MHEIGAPPHSQPWPQGEHYDRGLLEKGDYRNVLDKYRYWTVEAIKADLDTQRLPLEVAVENLSRDFNMGTIIRTANALNVRRVHIIGRRQWNKRGAMVTDLYMNIEYHASVDDFMGVMNAAQKNVIAVDIVPKAKPLAEARFSANDVLVFGAEKEGVSEELQSAAKEVVCIEQLGSTRSMNVGVAAGIAMYEWVRQNRLTR